MSIMEMELMRYSSKTNLHEGGNFYPGTGAADEVGTNGGEGYCVNVPWSCGGVGDNVYIYAFQHVVIRIAGFDAGRGDSLGCCDVTPAGYSRMTQMLGDLCGGKMLVILEGGYVFLQFLNNLLFLRSSFKSFSFVINCSYNLRSISSSATSVMKVLMGESRERVAYSDYAFKSFCKLLLIKSGEKEASSGPYIVKMESKEAFVQLFILRADIIDFYTNGVTCELKSLLEPRHKKKKEASYSAATHQKELMEQAIWNGDWKSVAMCTISFKKNASPKSLSLLPTKYALWNLFHQVLSNTEDIQSSAVDLLTYTSQAGLFESHTRFTVLNDVDETGNEPMSSLSLTKGGEQG
ncbi:unnamed protein product [Brassica oleracea]|uniref:histone deacetylase n=1 Tax=Brassica napus TaxID=3708 RepID=A0A816S0A8_BRANA|nr:unnamed protein product [Brassica napus]